MNRAAITAVHIPTGIKVRVTGERSLYRAKELAKLVIASTLNADPQPERIVRTYNLEDAAITDEASGRAFKGEQAVNAVLDSGDIDSVRNLKESIKCPCPKPSVQ